MAGLVEKFENWKTKMRHTKDTKKDDKLAKGESLTKYATSFSPAPVSSQRYRDNYDRIDWGKKSDDTGGKET